MGFGLAEFLISNNGALHYLNQSMKVSAVIMQIFFFFNILIKVLCVILMNLR